MKLGAFAPQAPFLPALARLWLESDKAAHEGLIILPSRRAAQALAGAFLEANGGQALLLPRIIALGNIDEAGLLLTTGFSLPPAIPAAQRQAHLARLILAMNGEAGAPQRLGAAWALAAELAALLDEADHAETDLAATLPNVVAAELAEHWQKTLQFLSIVTHAWPAHLAANGLLNPAARLVKLIDAQAAAWRAAPPAHRVWMVAAEGTPAIARMAGVVASLPQGLLILPGFDPGLDDKAWDALDDSHAQGGIARLLAQIGARREEVRPLPAPRGVVPAGRGAVLSRALLPAAALSAWQDDAALDITGLARLETPDEAQNATAIAMILRGALDTPGTTAALITPDRGLAARVAAALHRFGITADDSAGEPLAQTPPAAFLRLLARAAAAEYAPLPLLALLKHPLAAGGLAPQEFRAQARRLELRALRGPRPGPGFDGLKFRLKESRQAERDFLDRLELRLAPLALPAALPPAEALRRLLAAAEALAATNEAEGAAALWSGEAGLALSERLLEVLGALEGLPDIHPAELAELLDELLHGPVVRRPRAKDGHPRIAIWGIQEAALQQVDVAVLGGLVEGVWPAPAEPGPWLSRPMRKLAGLPSPEQKIGQAAHQFFALASACREVVLAAPLRRERAPAVPARWLTRLEAMLSGAKLALPRHGAASWAAQLDLPARRERRPKPRPAPPAAARPKRLSVTEIATLMADPYAIYCRKVLGIAELDALDEESDQSLFGEIVHAGLAEFFADKHAANRPDATATLTTALLTAMRQQRPRAALEQWWAARLERIAEWVIREEQRRRKEHGTPLALAHEVKGELALPGGFTLVGRADRIERAAGGGVSLIDYKTGTVPSAKAVKSGAAPQLPLEAVMAEAGAFGAEFHGDVAEMSYLKLSGRAAPGEETRPFRSKAELDEAVDQAAAALPELFARYARAEMPYLAAPHPARETPYDAYAGISRRAEWEGEPE
ncbi:double-strand break repair protein AddB [Acidocella sp. KAb 2-4]|uniref:double-strand break repair protein AddB n=1 Tax=Acidocella sp. KAb 2-4 TaxID=2885158 RepID=UPI001D07ECBE|nr:double-strand break repair protein AddB [Acidocella sp. KAb 2-4]MCB5944476.1 double-strand break repair protein AddB [Acidocella sp. KAb 2-4]